MGGSKYRVRLYYPFGYGVFEEGYNIVLIGSATRRRDSIAIRDYIFGLGIVWFQLGSISLQRLGQYSGGFYRVLGRRDSLGACHILPQLAAMGAFQESYRYVQIHVGFRA